MEGRAFTERNQVRGRQKSPSRLAKWPLWIYRELSDGKVTGKAHRGELQRLPTASTGNHLEEFGCDERKERKI